MALGIIIALQGILDGACQMIGIARRNEISGFIGKDCLAHAAMIGGDDELTRSTAPQPMYGRMIQAGWRESPPDR